MPGDLSLQALGKELASVPELLREIRAELKGIRLALGGERPIGPRSARGELLTTAQAADLLGIAEGTLTVWRCTRRTELPYLKVGRCVRYKRSDLDAWVRAQQQGTAP
jgi:excisionase family DNA binding protein